MVVSVKNLVKEYIRGGRSFRAVDDVEFEIERGDFVNIIGKSGSGKSTLLNMLAGMITPTSGEIVLDGNNITDKNDKEISEIRNEIIGFIPQISSTLPYLNVIENVCVPFFLYKREGDPYEKAMLILDKLGISELAKSYPKELSGGELRRVLIARAMINDPVIIIADEPTSDLDVENTKEVMTLLKNINDEGVTLLIVSHELDTLSYGKKAYTMQSGKLIEGRHL